MGVDESLPVGVPAVVYASCVGGGLSGRETVLRGGLNHRRVTDRATL